MLAVVVAFKIYYPATQKMSNACESLLPRLSWRQALTLLSLWTLEIRHSTMTIQTMTMRWIPVVLWYPNFSRHAHNSGKD